MRIGITGGAGFIGSNLTTELKKLGYDVTILDDLSNGELKNVEKLDIDFIEGSITTSVNESMSRPCMSKSHMSFSENTNSLNLFCIIWFLEVSKNYNVTRLFTDSIILPGQF